MAKKFDMNVVKEYLKAKGERVGLVVACVLGLWFLYLGITSIGGKKPPKATASTWDAAITVQAKELEQKLVKRGDKIEPPPPTDPEQFKWFTWDPVAFAPFTGFNENANNKKRNPIVLPVGTSVDADNKQIQVDYVRGATL